MEFVYEIKNDKYLYICPIVLIQNKCNGKTGEIWNCSTCNQNSVLLCFLRLFQFLNFVLIGIVELGNNNDASLKKKGIKKTLAQDWQILRKRQTRKKKQGRLKFVGLKSHLFSINAQ